MRSLTISDSSYVESSTPPSGASEILNAVGNDWLENSSTDCNVSNKDTSSSAKEPVINNSDKTIENRQESRNHIADSEIQKDVELTIIETSISETSNNTTNNTNMDYVPSSSFSAIDESNLNITNNSLNFPINHDSLPIDICDVYVPSSKDNSTVSSLKQYFCPYCKTLQKKFARHLELKHKNILDVNKFIHFPKGNAERRKIIEKIRKYGNYLHNTDANLNTGTLITCRRPQEKFKRNAESYICCTHCKGFFSKNTLKIHYKKCNPDYEKGQKDQFIKGKQAMGYIHPYANNIMRRKVFPSFQDDNVSRTIRYDELLILFGNKLCNTYTLIHQYDMIRNYLRLLGRFKLTVKEINKKITDFASIFHPKYYDDVIKAVKICANYNSESQIFGTPYNAVTLGTLLKKCSRIQAAEYIKREDSDGKEAVDNFMVLFDDDYPVTINKKVTEDRENKRRQRKIVLPSKSDIQKLYTYAKNVCDNAIEVLREKFDLNAWKRLSEGSLILLQMFNRRRAGEIERLLIENYENQETIDKAFNPDMFNNISEESQKQAKQFVRIIIRGKLGRTVPVLLHTFLISYIDILLKYRLEAGVSARNKYIFAVPRVSSPKKGYIRACPIMRKFAVDCDALIPTSLRGTMLRKHIATYTAMLRIEETQVSDLANFMGHDKQIHKDVYRVPNGLIDITEVSRLLQDAMGDNESENERSEESNNSKNNTETDDSLIDNAACGNHIDNVSINDNKTRQKLLRERSRIRTFPISSDDDTNNSDKPQQRQQRLSRRLQKCQLNNDDSDEILSSNTYSSSCKFLKNLL